MAGIRRIRRDYSFGKTGDLVITHSIAPAPGSREVAALWVIAQTIPTEAIFVPLPENSPYKDGYFRFDFTKSISPSWASRHAAGPPWRRRFPTSRRKR